ncbi:transglycosylase SLT domain-containing protein [Acrocarpospora phusangensis]|uniref:transglycosylase SLT domain-containing protein n=1 Tax=Acrocarpospora phusangensis TaxID=1070424 RepID=UPI00194F79F1
MLDYDAKNLSPLKKNQIISSLMDPVQNIFMAAKYLRMLSPAAGPWTKETAFKAAAKYNGGPGGWKNSRSQGYARRVISNQKMLEELLR